MHTHVEAVRSTLDILCQVLLTLFFEIRVVIGLALRRLG